MTPPVLPPDLEPVLQRVLDFEAGAKGHHEAARRKWERYYSMYRSYRELKHQHRTASATGSQRDVDDVLRQERTGFGADLFVPYVFSVIETTLPRVVDSLPRLRAKPCDEESERNSENVRVALEHQQSRMRFQLALQDVGKSGLLYGLGVGKTTYAEKWRKNSRYLEEPEVRTSDGPQWVEQTRDRLLYAGPRVEAVDIFDFIWHPAAHDLDSLDEAIHRVWRSTRYVREMFESGEWELPPGWVLDDVLGLGSKESRDEIWRERMAASGHENPEQRGNHVHEVWEFHDGNEVITILDRSLPVQHGANPFWHGEDPFQIYRPTRVLHEMVGIGEPEAIEDLQEEMNAMRSQRRDNATIVLQRPFAYFDGLVDPNDLQFGPGLGIPVDGDPRELLFPLPLQDIPFSSYQEEDRLQRDIERVTGIDDTVSGAEGGGGASATATGVQLVQAAAGVRIRMKAKRLVWEFAQPSSQQQLEILQQKANVAPLYVPKPADTPTGWTSMKMGPAELAGQFEIEVEGDSMLPENQVQRLEEANRMMTAFGEDPLVDPVKVREYSLERYGVDDVKAWIVQQGQAIPAEAWELFKQAMAEQGIDPAALDEMIAGAIDMVEEQQQGGEPGGEAPEPSAA
jgi:hypothetical protein